LAIEYNYRVPDPTAGVGKMFEELIAHGKDIILRLEGEEHLTPSQADQRPAHERVPIVEAQKWQERLEERIRSSFGLDTFERYESIWDMHRAERDQSTSRTEASRFITTFKRIVRLMEELDQRAKI
jgi:hypothetical protein